MLWLFVIVGDGGYGWMKLDVRVGGCFWLVVVVVYHGFDLELNVGVSGSVILLGGWFGGCWLVGCLRT